MGVAALAMNVMECKAVIIYCVVINNITSKTTRVDIANIGFNRLMLVFRYGVYRNLFGEQAINFQVIRFH